MATDTALLEESDQRIHVDPAATLAALPTAVVVLARDNTIAFVNGTAEFLLRGSASHLAGHALDELIPADNPLFALLAQVRSEGTVVSNYDVALESPRIGHCFVNMQAAPLPELDGGVVLTLQERSIADKIARQLNFRGAARSVTALAAMLAHEVKNPLSGIRGAAQLLEQHASEDDKPLTALICDEADRICALVDRMDMFADSRPVEREAVNIHRVLEHVRKVAENGFARHVHFVENYDPSLPPVWGDRDQLIQVFLNLVKNAAEEVPAEGGEIVLGTAYQHGVRFAVPGSKTRVDLPLLVTVQDNGPGIPEDIRPYLFEPFVTGKPKGTGLGLALVAKIVGDHGGVIECESRPRRTVCKIMLPIYRDQEAGEGGDEE
jgi:two-component system nitrogen regulation sensor histidine kinase GlnL